MTSKAQAGCKGKEATILYQMSFIANLQMIFCQKVDHRFSSNLMTCISTFFFHKRILIISYSMTKLSKIEYHFHS